jgi:hypothetical protein
VAWLEEVFFFEKKNQKTFAFQEFEAKSGGALYCQSFCFFFQKEALPSCL